MTHFAKVENGIVTQVIVADQHFIDSGAVGNPLEWIQTSYNTLAGVHLLGGVPLRKNFAGIGYIYDPYRDAFIPHKPYASWLLDEETCQWHAPVERPGGDESYQWNEETLSWELVTEPPV
jgi:hypothetical protein